MGLGALLRWGGQHGVSSDATSTKGLFANRLICLFQLGWPGKATPLCRSMIVGKYYLFNIRKGERSTTNSKLQENKQQFPSGLTNLIEYIHVKNLKMGLMTDVGNKTKSGRVGSFNNEELDAGTLAGWGVDYLKVDNYDASFNGKFRYYILSQFVNQTSRPVYISLNNEGRDRVETWGNSSANSWRIVGEKATDFNLMIEIMERANGKEQYASQYGWNDPGPLSIGLNILSEI